jgi:DNA repair exonuclease SbcCD ATPase subunit
MEHQRQTSEKRIGDLDDVVKRYTQTTLALESKVIELQNVIRRFEDVEAQLRTERELNRQLTQRNQDL